jgi:hypothetical protein
MYSSLPYGARQKNDLMKLHEHWFEREADSVPETIVFLGLLGTGRSYYWGGLLCGVTYELCNCVVLRRGCHISNHSRKKKQMVDYLQIVSDSAETLVRQYL